ncbi:hypothetical protein JOD03_001403 [Chryseomicrobium aureum]|uniref:SMI1/KNR4 family protein n=1 Tax=Chryseomicrobium aureum TaxID=1441723 RepID=UPI00195B0A20|nr:SMI1/KNR4 family protein [Chryseomicrobium aureum]MBM7706500.1 hypothetical protein [Chryseomicrobium aureum]
MSELTYIKAKELIFENEDLADFSGERPINFIEKAERVIGLKFPSLYSGFLKEFGYLGFGAQEVYGIINDDFVNSSIPDGIWYTLQLREDVNLPSNFLAICYDGMEEVYCLDFNNVDKNGEPKVVAIDMGYDLEHQKIQIVAEDFGDFLLELVELELELENESDDE